MIGEPDGDQNMLQVESELKLVTCHMASSDFICTFRNCGKRFKRKRNLRVHESVHQDVKPFRCEFEGCSASYARRQHLVRHVEADHSKPDAKYKCTRPGCVASFDTSKSLLRHVTRKHGGVATEKFNCDLCSSSFTQVWQLQEHLVTHGQRNPFKCGYCEESFDVYSVYKAHLKQIHAIRLTFKGEKFVIRNVPYECVYCKAQFKKWRELTLHSRTEHPFSCQYCSQTFIHRSRLRAHSCVQNQVRQRFNCPEEGCAKSYLHERNLTIHIRAAHKGEVYTCSLCQKKLRTKQKLQEHAIKIHENPLPPRSRRPQNGKSVKQSLVERLTGASDPMSLFSMTKMGPKRKPKAEASERE